MVFYEVTFKSGTLNENARKEALKILRNAKISSSTKVLSQDDFISFKRVLELYLKKMELVVHIPKTTDTETQSSVGV